MCFSAEASFIASGTLAATGAATVIRAQGWRQRLYAAIPLAFAVQQFAEGWQWLAEKGSRLSAAAGYSFLFFAVVFWPIYVPIAVYALETNKDFRRRLRWFIPVGAAVGLYGLYHVIRYPIVVDAAACCHIRYVFSYPGGAVLGAIYAAVCCGSLLMSSRLWVNVMGAAMAISLVIAMLIARVTVVSVWCFFSAILSIIVFMNFQKEKHAYPHHLQSK